MNTHIETIEDSEIQKSDKGFTLIELLIVIVILGILATVTVFAVRGITDRGQQSACDADEQTLSVAVEAYFADQGGLTIPGADSDARIQELIDAGLVRDGSVSDNFTLAADGSLTPTAGGDCV